MAHLARSQTALASQYDAAASGVASDAWTNLVSLVAPFDATSRHVWTNFPRLKRPDVFSGGGDAKTQALLRAGMLTWNNAALHTSLLLPPSRKSTRTFEALAVKMHKCILQLCGDVSLKETIPDLLRTLHDTLHVAPPEAPLSAGGVSEESPHPPLDTLVEEFFAQMMKHLSHNARIESEMLAWKLMCYGLTSTVVSRLKIFNHVVHFVLSERTRLEMALVSGAATTYTMLSPYINYALRALEVYQLAFPFVGEEVIPPEHVLAHLVFDPMLVDLYYPDGSLLLRAAPLKASHTPSLATGFMLAAAGLSSDDVEARDAHWRGWQRHVTLPPPRPAGDDDADDAAAPPSAMTHVLQTHDRIAHVHMLRDVSAAAATADASSAPPSSDAARGMAAPEAVYCAPSADVAFPCDSYLRPHELCLLQMHGVNLTEAAAEYARCITSGLPLPKLTIMSLLNGVRRARLALGAAAKLVASGPLAMVLRRRAYVHDLTPHVYKCVEDGVRGVESDGSTASGAGAHAAPSLHLHFQGPQLQLILDDSADASKERVYATAAASAGQAPSVAGESSTPSSAVVSPAMKRTPSSFLARATSALRLTRADVSSGMQEGVSASGGGNAPLPPVHIAARMRLRQLRTEGTPIEAHSVRERALLVSHVVSDLQNGLLTLPLPAVVPAHAPVDWSDQLAAVVTKVFGSEGCPARDAVVACVALSCAGRAEAFDDCLNGVNDVIDSLTQPFYDTSLPSSTTLEADVQAVVRAAGVRERLLRAGRACGRDSWLYDVLLSAVHRSPLFCASYYLCDAHADVSWPTSAARGEDSMQAHTVCMNAIKYGVQRASQAHAYDAKAAGTAVERRVRIGDRYVMLPPPSALTGTYEPHEHPKRVMVAISAWGVSILELRTAEVDVSDSASVARAQPRVVMPPDANAPPVHVRYSVPFSHARWYVESDGALLLEVYEAYAHSGVTQMRADPDLPLYTLVLSPVQPAPNVPKPRAGELAEVLNDVYEAWRADAATCAVRMTAAAPSAPATPASATQYTPSYMGMDPAVVAGARMSIPWRPSFRFTRGATSPTASGPNLEENMMLTTPARVCVDFTGLGLRLGVDPVAASSSSATAAARPAATSDTGGSKWFSTRRIETPTAGGGGSSGGGGGLSLFRGSSAPSSGSAGTPSMASGTRFASTRVM